MSQHQFGWSPAPPRPLDAHAAAPAPRRRGRGWGLLTGALVIGLVWGLLWGLYVDRRTKVNPGGTIAVGQPWIDEHGTKFYVVSTEAHDKLSQGEYSPPTVAPAGSTYFLVELRYTDRSPESYCSFDLLGAHGEVWGSDYKFPRGSDADSEKYTFCPQREDNITEATFWLSFLVRTQDIPGARLGKSYMAFRQKPALALPPPS